MTLESHTGLECITEYGNDLQNDPISAAVGRIYTTRMPGREFASAFRDRRKHPTNVPDAEPNESNGVELPFEEWHKLRKEADQQIIKEANLLIDPKTAEVAWFYADAADPYWGLPSDPLAGRTYYACAPGTDEWVAFQDLPEGTRTALCKRGLAADEHEMSYGEWLDMIKEASQLIEPATAEVCFDYGDSCNPYGIFRPDPEACFGRVHFARAAKGGIWVSFDDLPDKVRGALWKMYGRALSFPNSFGVIGPADYYASGGKDINAESPS
jgi:hypothetical protein